MGRRSDSPSPAPLKDAPLLILDEATVHLDVATEASVHEALVAAPAGCTVVVIADRLRLAALADQVIVLEGGRVVEAGDRTNCSAAAFAG